MDEGLEQQIKAALSNPEVMQKVSGLLGNLTQGSSNENQSDSSGLGSLLKNIGGDNLTNMIPNDDRTRLLLAIKPFLSEKRAPYMDSAVNILKLVSVGKIGKDLKLF